ncbi:MAG TPA: hypothetical protein VFZ66_27755 [Herpetosiphonaceae bacterium]
MTHPPAVPPSSERPWPLAAALAYALFCRAAQFRRTALSLDVDEADGLRPQLYANAEASVLVLETILTGVIAERGPDQRVALTEQATRLLDALTTTFQSMAPPEAGVVTIAKQLQRQCWLPHRPAVTLLQALLVVVLTAVNDGAFQVVVTLPREPAATLELIVDADVAGLTHPAHAETVARVREELAAIGGALTLELRPHCWRVRVAVPDDTP